MPNARTLAFIGCRLLSLFIVFQILQKSDWIFLLGSMRAGGPSFSDIATALGALAVGYGVPFLILWFGAGWFSKRIAGGHTQETTQEPLSQRDLLSLGIALVGLFVFLIVIPRAMNSIHYYFFVNRDNYGDLLGGYGALFATLLSIVMAAWCVVGSRSVAALISKLRRW